MDELKYKNAMPVLPLRDVVVFPRLVVSLYVGRKASLKALDIAMEEGGQLFLVTQKSADSEAPEEGDLYTVGCIANVLQMLRLPDGTMKVLVEGASRARAKFRLDGEDKPIFAEVTPLPAEDRPGEEESAALRRALRGHIASYAKVNNKIGEDIIAKMEGIDDLGRLVDLIVSAFPMSNEQKQSFLAMHGLTKRIDNLLSRIAREIEVQKIERKIRGRVKNQIEKNHREYYLQEQARAIQKELGDDQNAELEDFKKRVKDSGMSKQARKKCDQEVRKLQLMSPMSAEATVTRSYLDTVLSAPWKKRSEVNRDSPRARRILDADHYGLEKIKERILEYLAVQKRVPNSKSPILCFVGPPGVGKTSLGRSIAAATGRVFGRIALGGVRDEAEIRGHRRTYVGSMPGKIIHSMIRAEVKNPVILLDEIDKMGYDFRGDPSAALLEVLDPEQNSTFTDHYLEVEYDLSEVMFVTTANSMDIPPALMDRLEIIRLSGYTEDEKINIARRHLIPKQYKENGLAAGEASVRPQALRDIVRYYTREAGVRSLERSISRICRKVVLEADRKAPKDKTDFRAAITPKSLEKYLGVRQFRYGIAAEENQIGQVNGLAWTEAGGELLTIEACKFPGSGKIIRTGKLGEVMRESVEAGLSSVRARAEEYGLRANFMKDGDFHIHFPEGAIPKDGPSAGIAIATAVLSTLSGIAVRANTAMTGEITLRGEVLPIGGVKEKLLAASRGGIKRVILPKENEKDLTEIPVAIKGRFEICLVRWIDEVFNLALVEVPIKTPRKKKETAKLTDAQKDKAQAPLVAH